MKATSVLREQMKMAHYILEQAMDGLPDEHLHRRFEGATIQSIATIYTHAVAAEDFLIHKFAKQEPLLYERDGWRDRLMEQAGIDLGDNPLESMEAVAYAVQGKAIDQVREYAQAVYATTDEYLSTLSEDDLIPIVEFPPPLGDMPRGQFLGSVVAWETIQHGGEICALKGIQGGKGLPF